MRFSRADAKEVARHLPRMETATIIPKGLAAPRGVCEAVAHFLSVVTYRCSSLCMEVAPMSPLTGTAP